MPARNPAYVAKPTPSFCWVCGDPLPDFHAGKCARCRGGDSGIASLPIAPHCTKCGAPMLYAVGSPMAKFNPKCRCETKEE